MTRELDETAEVAERIAAVLHDLPPYVQAGALAEALAKLIAEWATPRDTQPDSWTVDPDRVAEAHFALVRRRVEAMAAGIAAAGERGKREEER